MRKHLGATAAVIVVSVLGVIAIQREGDKTRESIKDAGEKIGGDVREGIVNGAERTIDKAAEVPGKVLRDVKDVLVSTGSGAAKEGNADSPASADNNKPASPAKHGNAEAADPKPTVAETRPTKSDASESPEETTSAAHSEESKPSNEPPQSGKPKSQSKTKPAPAAKFDPAELLRDAIKAGQGLTKTVDDVGQEALGLSLAEENQIGKDVHREVIRRHKVAKSPAAEKRLRKLAEPLLSHVQRDGIDYTFTVLASPEINAFSHLGGYVYINQGILDFANGDAELQFVVAHEIAHVELGHCRRGLTYTVRSGELTGNNAAELVQMAYKLISLGYSEEQEFEADEWAFRHMVKIGRKYDEALAMPRHFAKRFADKTERQQSTDTNRPSVIADEIEKHLRSHPPATERVRRLERLGETDSLKAGSSSE